MVSNDSDAANPPPRIGITTYLEPARYGVWDQESAVLPRTYVDGVAMAGGVPVLLPPVGVSTVAGLDGLVLAGGADVDPSQYGQPAHPRTAGTRPARDAFERGLLAAALAAHVPVLGVCRGVQMLNVAFGGTLVQHVPDVVGHEDHQPAPAQFGSNQVKLTAGTKVAAILGETVTVQCYHHQSIGELADGLTAVGWHDDGTVEAVEAPGDDFVLGVQWHPEETLDDLRLFQALVAASSSRYRGDAS